MKNRRPGVRSFGYFACLWALLAGAATCRAADTWEAPATDLARQIAALTGPGTVSLTLRNNSSISADDIPVIRRSLVAALTSQGITVRAADDAATVVRVTLSQNARQGVWVAEVQQGPEVRIAMETVANSQPPAQPEGTPILLRKTLLLSQSEPILDLAWIAAPGDTAAARSLLILSPEQITIYRRSAAQADWALEKSFAVAHSRPYPRDTRGRLQVGADGNIKAYLPGVICTASQQTAASGPGIAVSCADSDDPWPLGSRRAFYNSSRDYFTGVLIPSTGSDAKPFYSVADLVGKRGAATVFSGVDGQFRVLDGAGLRPLAGSRDWGSDIAGVQSQCGAGAQLLATASGDVAQDSLIAYEVEGHSAVAVSPPLQLDGRVAAMWSAAEPASAILVLEKEQPLLYEAYSVSLVCNQ